MSRRLRRFRVSVGTSAVAEDAHRCRTFPKGGEGYYFDMSPVLWVSRDINRAQFDSLADDVRWGLGVSTERWPSDGAGGLFPKPSDIAIGPGGRIVVSVIEPLTYEQLREFDRVARRYMTHIEWEQPA